MLTDRRSLTALKSRLLAVALLGAALPGCAIGYLAQAGHGQWQLMRARRPIPQVIADPASGEALRARLRVVQDARDFAVSDLGLPDNGSYLINGQPVPKDQLDAQLHAIYDPRPAKLLFVKAGQNRIFQEVIEAMDVARGAGVQVIGFTPKEADVAPAAPAAAPSGG